MVKKGSSWRWAIALGLVAALSGAGLVAAAPDVLRAALGYRVAIDLVVTSQLSPRVLALLKSEVDRIWAPYGIAFAWNGAGEDVEERRRLAIADSETDRPQASAAHTALAWIWFESPTRPGHEIQASVDAARRLVGAVKLGGRSPKAFPGIEETLLGRALGRSVAHEVGHFLLASPHHSDAGLMRALFLPDDLLRFDEDDYALNPAEQRSLTTRTGPRPTSGSGDPLGN